MLEILYTVIIYPIIQLIEVIFAFSQKVFKHPGVSLLMISGAVSVFCLPLYYVAERWQEAERKIQKKLKPSIERIKAVFKNDEQYMILATLYRQNHYHPVYALRSAFGLMIQIPFFIAAYSYLSNLAILKGVSFLGITDLGAPDKLISLYGGINLLPLLMTLINCAAGAVYTKGLPPRDKIQIYGMAFLFLILLYNSPSGLVVYWTMNQCFSFFKNIYYKTPFKSKQLILSALLSLFCFMVIYYLMAVYKGFRRTPIILSVIFGVIGVIPWLIFIFKNNTIHMPCIHFSSRKKFIFFILSFLSLWIISGLFIPSQLISSSTQEFSYIDSYTTPLYFIFNTAIQSFGCFVFWPICLYFLSSKNIKILFVLIGFILCSASLCNYFFFTGNYGLISIDFIFEKNVDPSMNNIIINAIIMLFLTLFVLTLFFINKYKVLLISLSLCMFSLTGVSAFNIISINREFNELAQFHQNDHTDVETVEPIIQLSKTGNNIIIIMLDRALNAFIPFIFEESPELRNIYSGFTYYPNTVSFNGFTHLGSPPIFGSYEYTPQELNKRNTETMVQKHNEALLLMPRLFSENDFSVVVTDPPYPNYSFKEDLRIYNPYKNVKAYITDSKYTKLWLKEHNFASNSTSDILKRNMLWYSLFKMSPYAFHQAIYLQGDWCAPVFLQKMTTTLNGYSVLDYLPRLTNFNPERQNTALIMVNNTTHDNSFFQAHEYYPAMNITNYGTSPFKKEQAYHVNAASIKRLADWFIFLKSESVYDNTRIILVSDHGPQMNYTVKNSLPFALDNFNPLLLVKDFDSSGPIKTDMTFMSNADVPVLALSGQVKEMVNPFTGREISSSLKEKPLYIAISGSIHPEKPTEKTASLNPKLDYYVHGNIFDLNNWIPVEK